MNDSQILEIFYNRIVPEAQHGKINFYFTANIAFNLVINNEIVSKCDELPYEGLLIPTLKISDKQAFDNLLIEYVKKAIEFYNPSDFSFLNNLNDKDIETVETKTSYLIKYIISTLFANASLNDFENPIKFLESRISMFENRVLNANGEVDLGYIDSIGARMYIEEEKSPIKSETPYRIKGYLQFDDDYKLLLPEIYVGNNGKKYQLYGIQKTTENSEIDERPYLKQIRKGFIAKINGAPEHYFLTVMLLLSLCNDKEIELIPFLIERWDAKRIAMYNKAKRLPNFSLYDIEEEQDKIQNNITNIFIRYITKLEDVSNGIDFTAIPYESDTNLCIRVSDTFQSRSIAFNELFKLAKEYKNNELLTSQIHR